VAGINCKFVYTILSNFYSSFCTGFMQVNFMLLIFMVGSSLSFYFKMVFEYQLDLEVYNQEMWKKAHPESSDDEEN
jgi:hypothetical protein